MVIQRVLPVLISVAIIVAIAILRERSETAAALTATMPINVTLAMWIVYSAEPTDRAGFNHFIGTLFTSIWPTVVFLLVVWLAARAGWRVLPVILAGYLSWTTTVLLLASAQRLFT